jgi:hypothetical protein
MNKQETQSLARTPRRTKKATRAAPRAIARYDHIIAEPPWDGALAALEQLPVGAYAAADAVLTLLVPAARLQDGLALLKTWGFPPPSRVHGIDWPGGCDAAWTTLEELEQLSPEGEPNTHYWLFTRRGNHPDDGSEISRTEYAPEIVDMLRSWPFNGSCLLICPQDGQPRGLQTLEVACDHRQDPGDPRVSGPRRGGAGEQ